MIVFVSLTVFLHFYFLVMITRSETGVTYVYGT